MNAIPTPSLFGLSKNNSNKDFSKPETWGKNQFNNAFPVALSCYAYTKSIEPVYITLDNSMSIFKDYISIDKIFGLAPLSNNLFFSFESDFTPYRLMVLNSLARTDLVTINTETGQNLCLRPLEIKLTALPDNTTAGLHDDYYGCEIVVRPDTILYLALNIALIYNNDKNTLRDEFNDIFSNEIDWTEFSEVRPLVKDMIVALDNIMKAKINNQLPFMIQPIWKTEGKTLHLHDNCFDIFVWSDYAFTRLFIDNIRGDHDTISRRMRTVVWLSKMLYDFAVNGKIDYRRIINIHTYHTKNDKAFAISGTLTNRYMTCDELTKPRIGKTEIKDIVLGGGEKYLSPERRLDAAILASPELFQ